MPRIGGEELVAQGIALELLRDPTTRLVGFNSMPATATVVMNVHPGDEGVLQFDVIASRPFSDTRQQLADLPSVLRAAADMIEDQAARATF